MWRQLGKTGEVKCGWASHLPFHLSSFYTTHTATYTSFSSSSSSTNRRPTSTSPSFPFSSTNRRPTSISPSFAFPPPTGVPHSSLSFSSSSTSRRPTYILILLFFFLHQGFFQSRHPFPLTSIPSSFLSKPSNRRLPPVHPLHTHPPFLIPPPT